MGRNNDLQLLENAQAKSHALSLLSQYLNDLEQGCTFAQLRETLYKYCLTLLNCAMHLIFSQTFVEFFRLISYFSTSKGQLPFLFYRFSQLCLEKITDVTVQLRSVKPHKNAKSSLLTSFGLHEKLGGLLVRRRGRCGEQSAGDHTLPPWHVGENEAPHSHAMQRSCVVGVKFCRSLQSEQQTRYGFAKCWAGALR